MKTLLGHAQRQGAGGAIVLHAEEQHSPKRIPGNLELFDRDEADIVAGSRMAAGGNAFRTTLPYKFIADRCLTALENAVIGPGPAEYQSGYTCFNRRALETILFERLSCSFDFDPEMRAMAHVEGLWVPRSPSRPFMRARNPA